MVLEGGALGRYMGHEGKPPMNGIGAITKKMPSAPSPLPPHPDTLRSEQPSTMPVLTSQTSNF